MERVLGEFFDQALDRTGGAPGALAEVTRENDARGVLAGASQDFEGTVLESVLVVETAQLGFAATFSG